MMGRLRVGSPKTPYLADALADCLRVALIRNDEKRGDGTLNQVRRCVQWAGRYRDPVAPQYIYNSFDAGGIASGNKC